MGIGWVGVSFAFGLSLFGVYEIILPVQFGGGGGRGNMHFATSTNRAPRQAEDGRPGEALDVVLELRVAEDELFDRLAGRGRADDTPEVIRQRLVAYREQTEPLLKYYTAKKLLVTVDGLGSIDEVAARVKDELDKIAG